MKKNHAVFRHVLILLSFCLTGWVNAQTIGHWTFDEKIPGNSADITAGAILDVSGNAHHGTANEAMLYAVGSTNHGDSSALKFTLSADRVTIPDPTGAFNFSPDISFTFEAMIRTVNIGQDSVGSILAKQSVPAPEYWWRINATGFQQLNINDGNASRSVNGTKKLNDGQWHHIAVVFDAEARQLRAYVDYQLDNSAAAVYSTSGTIGNAGDLWIGAFQAGSRQFDGDIDFARVSLGALQPADFVQPLTYLADVSPMNGASFLPASTVASFNVKSPTVGVLENDIHVTLNGTDISSQLSFAGNNNDRSVTLPALALDQFYRMEISVVDQQGHAASQTTVFNTFDPNNLFIEAEDYNFNGGGFIDNPQLESAPGPNNYLDRIGIEGIDFNKTNPPVATTYRIGDAVGTIVSPDFLRQNYVDAQAIDPGVVDYVAKDFINGEWLNYSRTFPAETYRIYARLAKGGTVPVVVKVDEVISGSTTSEQTLSSLGTIRSQPTLNAQSYAFAPLVDAFGREVAVSLSGLKTLRLTMVSGTAGLHANYFIFVPETDSQVPFISALSPVAGAGNEAPDTMLQISIRNADTTINLPTTQLQLDGVNVTASATMNATSTGAQISYAASSLALGLHTVLLTFDDNTGTSITNTWQFRVANQLVRGHWLFNEKTNSTVSVTPGAIIDSSGNNRNGTANDPTMPYVSGSFNYGNTPALRFSSSPDRVVVPDATGNFNYNGSFTWEAVVRATGSGTTHAILAKNGTGDGEGEYWWRIPGGSGGRQTIGMNDGKGAKFLTGSTLLNDGNWHHVAVVYDTNAAEIRLYADYALDATLSNVIFTNSLGRPADLHIGSFVNGGSEFDGDIDFIRISNGALTTEEFIQNTVALLPIVKSMRPGTNAAHVFPTPWIQLELLNRDTQVLPSSFRIYIDGNEVTAGAMTTSDETGAAIMYRPTSPLADGLHTALVTFSDTASPANSVTNEWSFSVVNNEPILGFYQFNEKAPGNIADITEGAIRDSSGNNRHGTVAADGLPYVNGSTDHGDTSALGFTVPLAAHIAVPDPSGVFNFTSTQSITMEAIIRTTTIGQSSVGAIAAKQSPAPEWWWRINNNGRQQFNIHDGTGAKSVSGPTVLNDGDWHHIAVMYDGVAKQLRAYVDYVQDGAAVTTTYASETNIFGNALDLYIGRFQAGNRIFEGDIDAVRITGAPLDVSWFIPLGGIPDVPSEVQIVNLSTDGVSISFSFSTENGQSYNVQSVDALGGVWSNVETIPGDGTIKTVTYPLTGEQKFFQISRP